MAPSLAPPRASDGDMKQPRTKSLYFADVV
jgi:hypothetical protein